MTDIVVPPAALDFMARRFLDLVRERAEATTRADHAEAECVRLLALVADAEIELWLAGGVWPASLAGTGFTPAADVTE